MMRIFQSFFGARRPSDEQSTWARFPPPAADIDWSSIGVKAHKVKGHVQTKWSRETDAWSVPCLVRESQVLVDGLSPALNYGQQAYEGLKAFRGPDNQIRVFRLKDHAVRLAESCKAVSLPPPPQDLIIRCVLQAIAENAEFVPPFESSAALYIRPVIFGSSAQLNLLGADEVTFCVFVSPINALHGHVQSARAIIYDDFDRAAPCGTGTVKVGGNYAPVFRWSQRAKAEGFGMILHLDSASKEIVDEFSTSGFIGVKKSAVGGFEVIIAESKSAIDSITSKSCADIAVAQGFSVQKRPVKWSELDSFDEILAVGTAAAIVPIASIHRASCNTTVEYPGAGAPGSCFSVLLRKLQDTQKGSIVDTFGWNTIVCRP